MSRTDVPVPDGADRIAALEQQVAALQQQLRQVESERQTSRQATDRLRKLLDLSPSGVLVIDNRGCVSECNPAAERLLGTALQGERWVDVIAACFAPRPDDGHEVSLKNGRRVSLATRALEGEPGQLVFLSDQTDTRRLQQQLYHYQRLSELGRMTASLAHQVRTPLSTALLYASHLMSPQLGEEQRVRFAAKVKSSLSHLEQQVRDMLVFARGETRLENRITAAELQGRIDDLLDVPLAQYDADCSFDNQAGDLTIQCNLETLLGAVLNLVNNALQACGKGAELTIRLTREAGALRIDVIDQGPGMDAEQLKRALEPFYTTKAHGTGLGLAVAQVIARAHHGEFRLTSVPGAGTCASFLLPGINPPEGEQA